MASNTNDQQRQRKKENFLRQFRDEQSKEFKQLTAAQFIEIWSHYDTDGTYEEPCETHDVCMSHSLGNGFIEGHELDELLRELASSVNTNDAGPEVSEIHDCDSRIDSMVLLVNTG